MFASSRRRSGPAPRSASSRLPTADRPASATTLATSPRHHGHVLAERDHAEMAQQQDGRGGQQHGADREARDPHHAPADHQSTRLGRGQNVRGRVLGVDAHWQVSVTWPPDPAQSATRSPAVARETRDFRLDVRGTDCEPLSVRHPMPFPSRTAHCRPRAPTAPPMPTQRVLGVPLALTDYEHTLDWIDDAVAARAQLHLRRRRPHRDGHARTTPELRAAVLGADFTVPDGQPLVWALNALGHDLTDRVYGPELMDRACARAARTGLRFYLYGGRNQGALAELTRSAAPAPPGPEDRRRLRPPVPRRSPTPRRTRSRTTSTAPRADVVWVGIGVPKQEKWMARMRDRLDAPVLIGVGAAFDFHAGSHPAGARRAAALRARVGVPPRAGAAAAVAALPALQPALRGGLRAPVRAPRALAPLYVSRDDGTDRSPPACRALPVRPCGVRYWSARASLARRRRRRLEARGDFSAAPGPR